MTISNVKVNNFRNLDGIEVCFDNFCNFIIGENNLGKSNFLDLLNTITSGKSFHEDDFADTSRPIEVELSLFLEKNEWGLFDDNFDQSDPSIINISYRQKISDSYPTALCTDTEENIPLAQLRRISFF